MIKERIVNGSKEYAETWERFVMCGTNGVIMINTSANGQSEYNLERKKRSIESAFSRPSVEALIFWISMVDTTVIGTALI